MSKTTAHSSVLSRPPSTSTATTSPLPTREPAAARDSFASEHRDLPQRVPAASQQVPASSSARHSMSTSRPPSTAHHRSPSANLDRVARHDFEQSNLAQAAAAATHPRRSESHDYSNSSSHTQPSRGEPVRHSSGHSRTQSRYNDQSTPAPAPSSGGHSYSASTVTSDGRPTNLRRRTTIDAQTGHWELGKTIGAGSMGKVKLARNKETGETVAVKIVPRQSTEHEHRTQKERERADHSKEIRTAREAAIVTLVDHPYICGMRDVVRTNYHWYMLFEYVNGGQMLDYIISHGRLKEKQARKFGRQIASALDYCHRNSIVHRDLKIENILISNNGDIKIIDFGLSNLFSPRDHLKTFCGSLYFAAPELLQAKQYTGPEVDVWSFGIVLYVLVCGKVPFDDQSMPQLHAKIKKGIVEYPPWLTPECRSLIARMLTTNPSERATMQEIMNHPWMVKSSGGPPENYLPERKPITLPLDPEVIAKMTGFDFGTPEYITSQLTTVIESEEYQRAVRLQEKRINQPVPDPEQKRGVFAFYKRRSSTTSKDTLSPPSTEAIQMGTDPLNAYSPYLSVYYLAREKLEREAKEKNPGGLTMPRSPGEEPLKMPSLAAPEAAYTNSQAYEMAGEKPTGGRSRPRARTHGEDEVTEGVKNIDVNNAPSPVQPTIIEPPVEQKQPGHARKESAAVGLLRRFSKRGDRTHPPPALAAYNQPDGQRPSLSMRRTRDSSQQRSESGTRPETAAVPSKQEGLLSPPATDSASDRGKRHGLGRSISVNSSDVRRRLSRRGVSEGSSLRPPLTSADSTDREDHPSGAKDFASDVESSRPRTSIIASRTRSMGHARKESMQVRRSKRESANIPHTDQVPEETDQEIAESGLDAGERDDSPNMKPVYLKGLFSSSTTTSRPLNFIRSDIIRVLRELGVEYKEIRGGFSCRHAPSIVGAGKGEDGTPLQQTGTATSQATGDSSSNHRRKISFAGFRPGTSVDREEGPSTASPAAGRPALLGDINQKLSHNSLRQSDEGSESDVPTSARPISRVASTGGPTPRAAGETSTHVQSDLGGDLTLRFEIVVVKVPLLQLHGIQFKKVDGGTWQYKNMAQKILNELRL